MKRLALAFAAVLVLAAASSAQSQPFVVADVPFAFSLGDVHAPAGTYTISYHGSSNHLLYLTDNKGLSVAGPAFHSNHFETGTALKLVFHKYDKDYFLVAVQMPDGYLQKFPPSKGEKVTHRLVSQGQPEEVTVMAHLNK